MWSLILMCYVYNNNSSMTSVTGFTNQSSCQSAAYTAKSDLLRIGTDCRYTCVLVK